jgi:membrane fusion protein (multidrug efflux system)
MREGDPAEVSVDAFPGRAWRGHVESLSPATGARYALIPPDNATGNFTKVVQRVPVRVALDGAEPDGVEAPERLPLGLSVQVTVRVDPDR